MGTASSHRHDAVMGVTAYATFARYERLRPVSFLVTAGHALVLLSCDLFLFPSSMLLLATIASHAWHRHVAYRRVGDPEAVSCDRALCAHFIDARTLSVSGPCAPLFLGTQFVVTLAA